MKKSILTTLLLLITVMANALETGSWYSITINGKGIIIPQASTVTNTQLGIWTQTDVPSQLWQCTQNEDGSYSFMEGYNNFYMCYMTRLKEGTKVCVKSESTKRSYGNWMLTPVEGQTDVYTISTTDGEFLIGTDSTDDNGKLTLHTAATADPALTQWTITKYDQYVSTSFDEAARDKIYNDFIAHYYHPAGSYGVLGNGGWWGDAEMFETVLDAFETTGDKTYRTTFQKLVSNLVARNMSDRSYNEYNDDITWTVLASIRGYKYFNISAYLTYAKNNFQKMYDRALEPGGSLRWKQHNDNWYGSNSCINCPATVAACYLYEITGEEHYLEKAKNLYAFQRANLFNANTGQVYDSGGWDESWTKFTVGNQWASTYNQGTMLGAATKLYILTGEQQYKNDAVKVYNWSYNNLTNKDKIVHVCQTATGDLCGFKGIFMRYARLYAQTFNNEAPMEWMEKNAWFAMQNANSKGIIWSKWLTKTPENFMDGDASFRNDPFGASTAVSVAYNAHINRQFRKDAYSTIGAEMFDDIKFMQISDTFDDDNTTPNTTGTKEGYICFKNVEFGDEAATQAELRLSNTRATGTYTLYADKISEETKLGEVAVLGEEWQTYNIEIKPTTGTHHIYAVPSSAGSAKFHYMKFSNTTSGIDLIENNSETKTAKGIFNMAGQRLEKPQKGINIINGRKVIVGLP